MRVSILFFLFTLLALAFQSVWPLHANLLLIAVLFLGFEEENPRRGFGISLLIGFLLDSVSVAPFGSALFSFSFLFGLLRWLRTKILLFSRVSQCFWILCLTLVHGLFTYFWLQIWDSSPRPFWFYLRHQGWSALFNGGLSLLMFPFFRWYRHCTWEKIFPRQDPLLRR